MNEALPDLTARFKIKQGLFRKETVDAKLYELNGYGCVLKTDKIFEPGDTIVLDLKMDMPVDAITAEGVSGLVTEKTKHCSNFFYAIDFDRSGFSQTLAGRLQRVVDVLVKKQSLRSRRKAENNGAVKSITSYRTGTPPAASAS